jgi:hypothetical protein
MLTPCYALDFILNILILDFTPILGILLAIYLILGNLFILCYLVLALGNL